MPARQDISPMTGQNFLTIEFPPRVYALLDTSLLDGHTWRAYWTSRLKRPNVSISCG